MDRRSILKTAGLALAGSALLPFRSLANSHNDELNLEVNNKSLAPGKRKLGKLEVSTIGIGVQNMSRNYQTTIPSRPEMHRIIQSAYDNGVTLFDAAEAYGPFEVEKILGEGVASFRDKIVISTKFGWNIDQETGKRLPGLNSRPEHIKIVVEGMLKRLKTDRIDLLYQHRVDPQVPTEDVVGAIQSLIKEGKLLHYGLSEPGHQTVRRAHAIHPITAIQNEYSLLWRGPEKTIIPLCEELEIGFVPWSPLGVGFLTGAIDEGTKFAQGDIRGIESRFYPENLTANIALVELIQKWSKEKQAAPAQISLAWLLAQKPWIVPIPGTTQMAHMLENTGASQIKFSVNELQEFNTALNAIKILGERLPAGVLAFSDVEAPQKKI
ncbi:aldo/keto reductase [Flavobacterium sp. Leaf82]|uniref:aldo/keto reductase n=1 Tax=Flavobacterium sp. Leaf82 TaxID=1736238 RepID=UPI0006F645E2|nr:aldo/keto reductase [Flavobacterium sp. Leaf82]KQO21104.1 aldo/keto reductase [Flavobacterium sp. Leaf82]